MKKVVCDIQSTIEQMSAVGLGEISFETALETLHKLFGGTGALIFEVDRDNRQVGRFHCHGIEPGNEEYIERMHRIDTRLIYGLAHPELVGQPIVDQQIFTEQEMEKDEFIAWSEKKKKIRYFIGSRLFDHRERSVFVAVVFPRSHGHATLEQIAVFSKLIPHMAAASRIYRCLRQAKEERELTLVVTEALPWGLAVLGGDGRVVFFNNKARSIVACRDGLKLEKDYLTAVQGAENRTLAKLIDGALRGERIKGVGSRGTLSVTRPAGKKPLAIEILSRPQGINTESEYAVFVHIIDPDDIKSIDHEALAGLFNMSRREAELAELLGRGISLEDAAEQMGITHNTARNHLHNVLWKTDTHNQIELARLLGHLPSQS